MKISHVHTDHYLDIRFASGVGYHVAKTLKEQNGDIEFAGDLTIKYKSLLRAKQLYYKALGYRYQPGREVFVAKHYAAQIARSINPSSDVVFSPGTIPIAYLDIKKPTVFYTDGTFAGMLDFYESFTKLCPETIRSGHAIEQAALSNCSLAIYASEWAAQTAIVNYKVDPQKVKVVPFGANVECDRSMEDTRALIRLRPRSSCRLLFLGVDWERKRGDLAVQVMQMLNCAGLKTELHVAGIANLPVKDIPGVVDHGFISKSSREGRDQIDRLMADSHFLLLPTKVECFGIVFCEASSFGVPNLATRVGGVPTAVHDGVSGKLFDLSAPPDEYAAFILRLFSHYEDYEELALSSFHEYQNRLNWKVTGKKLVDLMQDVS